MTDAPFTVQEFDDQRGGWRTTLAGRAHYQKIAWASRRASRLATQTGQPFRVVDAYQNCVYEAARQLVLFEVDD